MEWNSNNDGTINKEQLMTLVIGPRTTGRQSFRTLIVTLSGPGDLLEGMEMMIRSTSVHDIGDNLNVSWEAWPVGIGIGFVVKASKLFSRAN